jgi:hypothetical protein
MLSLGSYTKTKVLGMGNKFYQRMDHKSLSHQITISEDEYYGYLFWNKTYKVNDVDYEVYYSSGNGGGFIFKDQPIVIVITSTAYNTPFGHKQADKIMQDYLILAISK